jgi:hypothetical protein
MGGCGSGRISGGGKELTSQFFQIDVRELNRQGRLSSDQSFIVQWFQNDQIAASVGARSGCDRIEFSYRQRLPGKEHFVDKQCTVLIEWSFCNYGGRRPWFRCPVAGCERRIAILYFGPDLACRQCCGLAYRTQRVPAHYRAIYRAQAIRKRLGGSLNLSLPLPAKPRDMHWQTYIRLCEEANKWETWSWPNWLLKRAAHNWTNVVPCPDGAQVSHADALSE